MDVEKKYIFIKSDRSLIIQMDSSQKEIKSFVCRIFRLLTEEYHFKEQPFFISNDVKLHVTSFLKENYFVHKKINKLIQFFSTIEEGKYIYFYPYKEQADEIYDYFKKSLEYYNSGCNKETILIKMKEYIHKIEAEKKMFNDLPYELFLFVPTQKIVVGESDKNKRRCIYCGGFLGDNKRTTFKEKAHAIPEALGNKKFIQNEECDSCNSFFAQNTEEDLSNMLMFNRLKYGIRGKNGYPIFQIGPQKYARYFNWKEEDYDKNWGYFEASKNLVKQNKIKCPVIVDIGGGEIDNQISVANIKDFCPMHAYKTMVKCVIGLIGNEKLYMFYSGSVVKTKI